MIIVRSFKESDRHCKAAKRHCFHVIDTGSSAKKPRWISVEIAATFSLTDTINIYYSPPRSTLFIFTSTSPRTLCPCGVIIIIIIIIIIQVFNPVALSRPRSSLSRNAVKESERDSGTIPCSRGSVP